MLFKKLRLMPNNCAQNSNYLFVFLFTLITTVLHSKFTWDIDTEKFHAKILL